MNYSGTDANATTRGLRASVRGSSRTLDRLRWLAIAGFAFLMLEASIGFGFFS